MPDPAARRAALDRRRRLQALAVVVLGLVTAVALRAAWLRRPADPLDLLVEVDGAVGRAGLRALPAGSTVREAIEDAGPGVPLADDPFLDMTAADGDRMELLPDGTVHLECAREAVLLGRPVDVNAAGEALLATVPGLGPATAAAVVADRAARGPFSSVGDLARVRGVGPATLARIGPLLVALPVPGAPPPAGADDPPVAASRPAGPVDLNTASAARLDTLPGIGPARAAAIVADREARGPFASVRDLDRVPGIGPATLDRIAPHVVAGPVAAPESP